MVNRVHEKSGLKDEPLLATIRENWPIFVTCGVVCVFTVVLTISALNILSQDAILSRDVYPAEPQSANIQEPQSVAENITLEPTNVPTPEINPSDLPLQANFTFGPGNITDALSVQFLDTSFGQPVQWKWDFGDGKQSVMQNPLHRYRFGGSHRVTLTVLDEVHNMSSTEQYVIPENTPGNATNQDNPLFLSGDDR